MERREFIKLASATAALAAIPGCASVGGGKSIGRVVVVGGGYAGATAAKYVRMWGPDIEVTLVERNTDFVSCPLSNLVLSGGKSIKDLTVSYNKLGSKYGVKVINDEVTAIDAAKRTVTLARGTALSYDRLIVAPGIDFMYDTIPGLSNAAAQENVLHAWKAGPQTVALRKQLEAMPDGGVFAISIPKAPFRCPPGPYERACLVAAYLSKHKPKSKVLILDANEEVVAKKGLFTKAWKDLYPGMVEYRANSELVDVDVKTLTAKLQFEDVKANVLNVIPPQRAGKIAAGAGLITANNRWCGVDYLTFESVAHKNIHVLGDAILAAPKMPKSGHVANQHAKVCAAAVVALMHGEAVYAAPVIANTCYSFVNETQAVHVSAIYKYDTAGKTMASVPDSGGLSSAATDIEGMYAEGWAQNIWADMLG
ncbi:MAG: sulfide dehydrogenase (flavocytochrome) flavoprotein subunit [Gallionellaceae bacterium]|nr:MAG: sulfide dehydrogenase (flavocytochrome) flavoprotein subunit [Gallionellaceae bacterium]